VIFTHVPYRADANLGRAYNEFMGLLPADAWACFLDHDAMPTTGRWHAQLSEAIALKPDAGALVAMTNRCARSWQRCGDAENNDMAWHRRYGAERTKVRTLLDITNTNGWAGVMFAVSKAVWEEVGGFAEGGLGCTDHSLHFKLQRAGRQVWLLESLYCFHWHHYGAVDPTTLLPKAANCPCLRMPKVMPTERVVLP
jgi:GT2 family glycosyltransferase